MYYNESNPTLFSSCLNLSMHSHASGTRNFLFLKRLPLNRIGVTWASDHLLNSILTNPFCLRLLLHPLQRLTSFSHFWGFKSASRAGLLFAPLQAWDLTSLDQRHYLFLIHLLASFQNVVLGSSLPFSLCLPIYTSKLLFSSGHSRSLCPPHALPLASGGPHS